MSGGAHPRPLRFGETSAENDGNGGARTPFKIKTMATTTHRLTLEEFRSQYADEKPYYEYWFGEAIQKSVATWLHAVLQVLLCDLLREAGYKSGSEVELRVVEDWQPKADVIGAISVDQSYPTKPVDVVAEVLSPDDKMSRVFEKCRQYERIGIPQILIFDPESKTAWEWSHQMKNLERISELVLPNGSRINVETIWNEMDRRK